MKRVVAALLALALTAAVVLPFVTLRAAPVAQPVHSLRAQLGHGPLRVIFHITDEECPQEILKELGVVDGAFYRRATLQWVDRERPACWLTIIADGSLLVEVPSILSTFTLSKGMFRPESRA